MKPRSTLALAHSRETVWLDALIPNVYLVESPVFELLASVFRLQCHAIWSSHAPKFVAAEFDLDGWVERTAKKIPDSVKTGLETFFNYESFIGLALVAHAWQTDTWQSVEVFLDHLRNTPGRELFHEFLKTGYTPADPKTDQPDDIRAFIEKTNLPPMEKWRLAYLYLDAEDTKHQFIDVVSQCYALYFTNDWEELHQLQQQSADRVRPLIQSRADILDHFPYMQGFGIEDPNTTVVLSPSVFYHLASFAAYKEQNSLFLTLYGIHFHARQELKSDELTEFLKILSDETRIKIIETLRSGACYGYELAQRLNLSSSTISHHLGLLTDSGIVSPTRQENRVSYELNRPQLSSLLNALTRTLTS